MKERKEQWKRAFYAGILLAGLMLTFNNASADEDWNCQGTIGQTSFACYGESSSVCKISGGNVFVQCKGTKMIVNPPELPTDE